MISLLSPLRWMKLTNLFVVMFICNSYVCIITSLFIECNLYRYLVLILTWTENHYEPDTYKFKYQRWEKQEYSVDEEWRMREMLASTPLKRFPFIIWTENYLSKRPLNCYESYVNWSHVSTWKRKQNSS